jgi:hypothetical protein
MWIVLDAGNIFEFGKPSKLLQVKDNELKALVNESGDKDPLHKVKMLVICLRSVKPVSLSCFVSRNTTQI